MKVIQHKKNVHEIQIEGNECTIALLSDVHWDNPQCDRDLLKKHLDHCLEHSIPIFLNGDTLCMMQGKYDRRASKTKLREEHRTEHYFDSIVETAYEYFRPYAHLISVVGYGNHETSILRIHETDILQRLVDYINIREHTNIKTGGYSGWVVFRLKSHNNKCSFNMHYHHGLSKGASVVTKGAIDLTRALGMYENMDIFTQGHIHQTMTRTDVRDMLVYKNGYKVEPRNITHVITGTYKDEYFNSKGFGWHVERGAEPRNIGGKLLKLTMRKQKNKILKQIDIAKFPI